jgi:hypothetical protein
MSNFIGPVLYHVRRKTEIWSPVCILLFFYLELSSAGFISVNQTKTSFGYVKLGLEQDTFGHD